MSEKREETGGTAVNQPEEATDDLTSRQASHYDINHPQRAGRPLDEDGSSLKGDAAVDVWRNGPLVSAQTPEESTNVKASSVSEVAGGIPAILSTVRHAWGEMGLVRGLKVLGELNQKDGFDCPGCAWPDPDDERAHTEFCENGAKHVADEATTKRVTPEFFQKWSVADLSRKSDYWLNQQSRLTHPVVLRRGQTHYEEIG